MPSRARSTISSTASDPVERRFEAIFARAHGDHPGCLLDPWLTEPCRDAAGNAVWPLVWSRRNGPWARVPLLFVGAAPGNAGGRGQGNMGAHGTRIPFGGDIAGANLEVLLGSIGLNRNDVFLSAAYNRLPAAGGGEPTLAELRQPVGDYRSSIALLRDAIVAAAPRMLVALGNIGLRSIAGAVASSADGLPGLVRLQSAGLRRGEATTIGDVVEPDSAFREAWDRANANHALPDLLWLTHPSAQNMSPFARRDTLFHSRMRDARRDLRRAVRDRLGLRPPARRPPLPDTGIYELPEWRHEIAPRFERYDALWRSHGI
jgi:uracil-DNA glycosylase